MRSKRNHHQKQDQASPRRGVIVILVAILLVPLLGMLAMSVDIGYVLVVKAELQSAADAAALAGAEKLQDLFVLYDLPSQSQQSQILTKATTDTGTSDCPMFAAKRLARANKAGGVSINVPDSDVAFGYTDAKGNYTQELKGRFCNTIDVTTRRQGSVGSATNGAVRLFSRVLGAATQDLEATARATIYSGDITSFKVIPGINSHILPVGLDMNAWQQFYQTGKSPDGKIHQGPNGAPQLQVYPSPPTAPGNFGLLAVGPPENNIPAYQSWIEDGQPPDDLSYLLSHNMLPVSASNPKRWKGGPGLKSTLVSSFEARIGKANLMPLYQPVSRKPYKAASGSGSNTYYAVVGFVGVQITSASGRGSSINISVQPKATSDAVSVISNAQPAGTQAASFGTSTTTFTSAKLIR